MNIFSLSVFLLSCGAKVDRVSNFHEIWTSDNLDHGQWTPVIDRKDRNYEKIIYRHSSSAVENYYSQSNQQHQEVEASKLEERDSVESNKFKEEIHSDESNKLEEKIFSVANSSLVEKIKFYLNNWIDSFAFGTVSLGQKIFGPSAEVRYINEDGIKAIEAFGIEIDLIFALDQFVLVMTEFVAYITTDVVFRIFWPV